MLRYCPLSGVKKYTPENSKPYFKILRNRVVFAIPDAAKTAREREKREKPNQLHAHCRGTYSNRSRVAASVASPARASPAL